MKCIAFLTLLFIIPFAGLIAQYEPTSEECELIVRDITDEATNRTRFVSKSEIRLNDVNTGDLYQIVVMRTMEDFSFILRSLKKNCFVRKTPVIFHFRNGTSITFKSINKDNCESLVLASMGGIYGNKDRLGDFLNEFLVGIEFKTQDKRSVRLKIGTPQNEMIQEVFECLTIGYDLKKK